MDACERWDYIIFMSMRWLLWAMPFVMLLAGVLPAGPAPVTIAPPTVVTPSADVRSVEVPILMYHHVGNPHTYQTYSVDQRMFEWQMDYLWLNGYHTVSLDDIAAALTTGRSLPDRPIALTFDDGWVQQITNTLPVLLKHNFRATYYVIVNATGRLAGNMDWNQLRQLRDAGMEIGSHTLSHGYLPGMSDSRLRAELVNSRHRLQQELSITVTSLAYPGGAFNTRVERMAREAGYTTAVTVIKGNTQRVDRLYRMERVGVYGVDTPERFAAKADGTFIQKWWPYPRGQATLPTMTPLTNLAP